MHATPAFTSHKMRQTIYLKQCLFLTVTTPAPIQETLLIESSRGLTLSPSPPVETLERDTRGERAGLRDYRQRRTYSSRRPGWRNGRTLISKSAQHGIAQINLHPARLLHAAMRQLKPKPSEAHLCTSMCMAGTTTKAADLRASETARDELSADCVSSRQALQ